MIANIANIYRPIAFDVHQIAVRAVREEEIHCVADIITQSFHFDRGWMGWLTPLFKIGIAEDLRHRLRAHAPSAYRTSQPPQQICSIAVYAHQGQTQVVGTIEVGVRSGNDKLHHHRYTYISNLAVSRDFRRQGVAQELLKECEQITKSWGYTELYLHVMADNDRGRKLYHKLGYELISTESVWSFIPWYRPERLFLRKQIL